VFYNKQSIKHVFLVKGNKSNTINVQFPGNILTLTITCKTLAQFWGLGLGSRHTATATNSYQQEQKLRREG